MNTIKTYIKTIHGNSNKVYGTNEVYADDNFYYIKAPKKNVFLMINKDDTILNYLETCISQYGCLHSTNASHTFEVCREHYGKRERIYVSQLLSSFYNNKKLNTSEKIIFKDGNNLNCTKENLIRYEDKLRLERHSISITADDNYIYIRHKPTGIQMITYYEPELLHLIGSNRISWRLDNSRDYRGGKNYNRLCGEVFYHKKKCKGCITSLSELVYGYYNYNVRVSNLTSALRRMKKDLRSRKLVVEHLMADELNNTKANLSLVDEITNSKKKVIDGKIQPPYYLIMAYKSGAYKAVSCFGDSEMMYVYPVITASNMETLLDTLKGLLSKKVLSEYKSAFQWHKDSKVKKFNLPKNYEVQRYLYDNFDNELVDVRVAEYIQVIVEGKER